MVRPACWRRRGSSILPWRLGKHDSGNVKTSACSDPLEGPEHHAVHRTVCLAYHGEVDVPVLARVQTRGVLCAIVWRAVALGRCVAGDGEAREGELPASPSLSPAAHSRTPALLAPRPRPPRAQGSRLGHFAMLMRARGRGSMHGALGAWYWAPRVSADYGI
jgi:hypothetical protein